MKGLQLNNRQHGMTAVDLWTLNVILKLILILKRFIAISTKVIKSKGTAETEKPGRAGVPDWL
jgi:hypothetical protein